MNGSELAHHIKEQHPDIAVIGISAFLDDENEKRYGAQWSDAFYAIIPNISNRFLRTSQQLRHDYEHGASRKLVVHMSLPMPR